jgi:hypothetical protein
VFVPGKYYRAGQILAGKDRSLPIAWIHSERLRPHSQILDLPENLAYFSPASISEERPLSLASAVKVYKLFSLSLMLPQNNPFSLAKEVLA